MQGARALENLKDGDQVLISEGCTHHRQCGDIGTVKLPAWIQKYTGKKLKFSFTSGTEFPEELGAYSLIVHCGGCMLNEREMKYRLSCAQDQGVPMTNYGDPHRLYERDPGEEPGTLRHLGKAGHRLSFHQFHIQEDIFTRDSFGIFQLFHKKLAGDLCF